MACEKIYQYHPLTLSIILQDNSKFRVKYDLKLFFAEGMDGILCPLFMLHEITRPWLNVNGSVAKPTLKYIIVTD